MRVSYFLNASRCLIVVGLCLASFLSYVAQTPQSVTTPVPAEGFCAPPLLGGGGRGVGSGSGKAATDDEVKMVFTSQEVTKKAEILFNPAPPLSPAAAGSVNGEVKLRVVLCPKGYLSNIEVLSKLPDGVRESTIEAVKNIRFIPAEKDGKRVAQYATLLYRYESY